jgi:protein TonB
MLLRFRHEVALASTVLVFAALVALPKIQVEQPRELPPPTMQVTLAPPPLAPTPPVPITPPTPAPPQPAVAESAAHPLTPPPKPVIKKLIIKPKHIPHQPPRLAAPPAAANPAPAAPPAPPTPPAQAPPGPPAAGAQNAAYAGLVTAEVKALHHYPTGREALTQHPHGTATVSFTLNRAGQLVDADIQTASGSLILDRAALQTVERASYPPFPADAFPGESQHSFSVNLDYTQPTN